MSAFWFFFFAAALAPSHGECTRLRRSIPPPSLPPSQCTTAEQLKAPRVLHKRDGYYCQLQDWLEKGKLIGRGTRAQVSAVESKDTSVLPHSQDGKGYALQQGIGERFQKEACFADFADRIGVGPKVFLRVDCFDVFGRNMGSLVMERLYSDFLDVIEKFKNLRELPPENVQRAVVGAHERLLRHGYVHSDGGPKNAGFIQAGFAKLLDFDQEEFRGRWTEEEKVARIRSVAQSLGTHQRTWGIDLPKETMEAQDAFSRIVSQIGQGKYIFGENEHLLQKAVLDIEDLERRVKL